VESTLPQDPVPYDGSIAWLANIAGPAVAYADSAVSITGSAWIDQGPLGSTWMSYGKYSLYYQLQGDTSWNAIVMDSAVEIRNSAFALWNTHALSANNYLLRLVVYNNLGDSVEAMKSIALIPSVLGVAEVNQQDAVNVFPDPVSDELNLSGALLDSKEEMNVSIVDMLGRDVSTPLNVRSSLSSAEVDVSSLAPGIYFVKLTSEKGNWIRKFVKE
jgi:hypothetical protein